MSVENLFKMLGSLPYLKKHIQKLWRWYIVADHKERENIEGICRRMQKLIGTSRLTGAGSR